MKPAAAAVALVLLAPFAAATAEQDSTPGLGAAPEWRPGDWWEVRFRPEMGVESTHRLVVAGLDKGEYLVGLSAPEGRTPFLVYHAPYFGRVQASDLSYDVHNHRFHPVQFPLEEGRTWQTQFNDLAIEAEVKETDGATAQIQYRTGTMGLGRAVYDADARTLTSFSLSGLGRIDVLAHGRGYACDAHYVDRYELLFLDHTTPGVPVGAMRADAESLRAFRTKEVDRPFERAALLLVVGGDRGHYAQQVVPPDLLLREATVNAADSTRWRSVLLEVERPAGTWRLNSAAVGGTGSAMAEAIGFDGAIAKLASVVPADEQRATEDCNAQAAALDGMPLAFAPVESNYAPLLLGALAAGAASMVAVAAFLRRPWWLLLLFAKIPPERVLDHRVRNDIHDLLKQQPGLTTQEIRRRLELGWGNTVHHLAILERAGIVAGTRWGHNRNWFLRADTPPAGRNAISALRREAAKRVFERIQASPGISQEDLARDLQLHHSTVIFHVDRLMRAELISKRRDGQRVRYYPGPPEPGARTSGVPAAVAF